MASQAQGWHHRPRDGITGPGMASQAQGWHHRPRAGITDPGIDHSLTLHCVCVLHRLRASHVLIIGIHGLGAEVSKNIVLAGVQEVTVMDHTPLEEHETANRFLMQRNGVNVIPHNLNQPSPHLPLTLTSPLTFPSVQSKLCGNCGL